MTRDDPRLKHDAAASVASAEAWRRGGGERHPRQTHRNRGDRWAAILAQAQALGAPTNELGVWPTWEESKSSALLPWRGRRVSDAEMERFERELAALESAGLSADGRRR